MLFAKLSKYGFSSYAILWFKSYLTDRYQAVRGKNNTVYDWVKITSGVSQGSVLGPLLFLIFINDLQDKIKACSRILYADELQIYIQSSPKNILSTSQQLLVKSTYISDWSKKNLLTLNPDKVTAMLIGRLLEIEDLQEIITEIQLSDGLISLSSNAKNLGVVIDSTLTWNDHIKKIVKTVNFILYRLRYFRQLTDQSLRRHLITSLVFSHLNYCCACFAELSQAQDYIIQKLFNSCVRFVLNIKRRDNITPHRISLG